MRSWRNWQTRKTKDLVVHTMQVQFLSTAPKKDSALCGVFFHEREFRQELRVEAFAGANGLHGGDGNA